ncbi:MAG TPA: Flp pilus assembly protein CpaB [Acidimicrobiales bacterium]|nr:Flp pilus assembly protein CpaB [Acidimicrobiales bacterium]
MGNRRAPIVAAALLVGGVASLAVWGYLGRVERAAFEGARLDRVFVVKSEIRQGTPADRAMAEGRIGADRVPSKFRPTNAVTDLEAIRGKIASTNLLAGQILADEYFSRASGGSAFAQQIPDGQVAISVQVEPVRGVANLVRPGDRVNIMVVTADSTKTLFQNVDVIAVGAQARTPSGDGPPPTTPPDDKSNLVTFAVPLPAAQKIALAASTAGGGSLYLTLVPPENRTTAVPPLTAANLFQGSPDPYL